MPSMRIIETTKAHRALPDAVPGVLRSAGVERTPEQGAGCGDAGRDRSQWVEPWTGASVGVRKPTPWEVPLSASEIAVGLSLGAL